MMERLKTGVRTTEMCCLTPKKIMVWLDRLGLNRDSLERYTEWGNQFDDANEELPFDRPHYSMYPVNCRWSQLGLALQAEKS